MPNVQEATGTMRVPEPAQGREKIIFDLFGPFSLAKTLSPVKAVINAAHLKEKPP
jgi:hypothetical protein